MPKIFLYQSGSTGLSGSSKSCFHIATILKKNRYFVEIGCLNSSDYWEELQNQNIPVKKFQHKLYSRETNGRFLFKLLRDIDWQIKKWFTFLPFSIDSLIDFEFISEIREYIKNEKFDLIHANTNFFRSTEILKIAKELALPIVCHLRGEPYRRLTLGEKKIAKYEKVRFIAVSKTMQKRWIEAGLPESKIEVIYNSQPKLNVAFQADRSNKKTENFPILILFVGRLEKLKGVDVLIRALSKIDRNKWNLSIVGDGPEKFSLENLAKEKKILKNITFYGFRKDVENFYLDHDILIVPSFKESFGRVIIEAMQFSVPVIASNIDGPAEIIDDGKDGILFEAGDCELLKEAIELFIDDPQKRIEIGSAGMEKQKLFSEEIFKNKLLKIYNQLLNNNQG